MDFPIYNYVLYYYYIAYCSRPNEKHFPYKNSITNLDQVSQALHFLYLNPNIVAVIIFMMDDMHLNHLQPQMDT